MTPAFSPAPQPDRRPHRVCEPRPATSASPSSAAGSLLAFNASRLSSGFPPRAAGDAARRGCSAKRGDTSGGSVASPEDAETECVCFLAEASRFAHAVTAFARSHSASERASPGDLAAQLPGAQEAGGDGEDEEDPTVSRAKAIQLLLALQAVYDTTEDLLSTEWKARGQHPTADPDLCAETFKALQTAAEALEGCSLLSQCGLPRFPLSRADPDLSFEVTPEKAKTSTASSPRPNRSSLGVLVAAEVSSFELTDDILELWARDGPNTDDEGHSEEREGTDRTTVEKNSLSCMAPPGSLDAKEREAPKMHADANSAPVDLLAPSSPGGDESRHGTAASERRALFSSTSFAGPRVRLRRRAQRASTRVRFGGPSADSADLTAKEEEDLEQELLDFAQEMKDEATRYGEVIQRDRDRLQRTGEAQQRHLDKTHAAMRDTKSLIYGSGFGFFYAMVLLVIGCILFVLMLTFILFTSG
ncbi:conserved hypothetical protein [Neospora caninum Liverpool]|uniref:Transmembrane protein n=1 Tax=Neospora caninum (strain Liverpool) TaxID=572307 RepID=F0V7W4_NEOCL|nr:conserved hypothetical protein [Neospora caninum Liverpool]CBZ49805.1 conserved hypothetical protein [Neospora caninum Liverpool]CEL64393.1 TPA: hypothetical protein BN1204_002920 [Neospora caninum Liverpool]|eukprot:XP_003879840.1 conserved hypothetical protein [Neospora caninum Liverpool]